jgi:exodeoxyribonuclease VII small subunit
MGEDKTFREAYATLQKHAQTLRTQQEPDIDNLTTIVTESVEAYKVCKQRIDAVEKALEQALENAQFEGDMDRSDQASATGSVSPRLKGDAADPDEDIPF